MKETEKNLCRKPLKMFNIFSERPLLGSLENVVPPHASFKQKYILHLKRFSTRTNSYFPVMLRHSFFVFD
jgi:hypothetical protein